MTLGGGVEAVGVKAVGVGVEAVGVEALKQQLLDLPRCYLGVH